VTKGFYELGLKRIYVKSLSYLLLTLIWASHFILSGFQIANKAYPCAFLFVKDAKCFVSLPVEKAILTHELKLKSPKY